MKQNEFYCVYCQKRRRAYEEDMCLRKTKNHRHCMKAVCPSCDTKMFKFISEDTYDRLKNKYKKCR